MLIFISLVFIFLNVVKFIQAKESLVHSLDESNFSTFIDDNPLTLVEFYAPWCGHCKNLAPKYAEAASVLAQDNIPLASVDCIAHESLYWSNNIKGYPTLLAFIGGDTEPLPYDGPRETANIVSFMRHLKAPVLIPIASSTESILSFSEKHRTSSKPVVFVFTGPDEESKGAERALDIVCRKFDMFACAVIRGDSALNVGRDFGLTRLPAMLVLPVLSAAASETASVLEPPTESTVPLVSELRSWILLNAFPTVVDFEEANMDLMFSSKRPGFQNHILLFIDKDNHDTGILQEFHRISEIFSGRCIFIAVDISINRRNEFTQNLLSDLGVSESENGDDLPNRPRLMIIKSARTVIEFYDLDDQDLATDIITGDVIHSFVDRFFDNSLDASRVIEMPMTQ